MMVPGAEGEFVYFDDVRRMLWGLVGAPQNTGD